jgi:uncharacterized protein YxjI
MQYPLQMKFKLLALATQIYVTDADDAPVMYIKQKMLKLKEHIEVFRDSTQQQKLFDIRADRVIDFSANYSFSDAEGSDWGAVRRKGMKSLWKAHYEIMQDGQIDMVLQEEKPWKKILEGLLGEIPVVGLVAVYLLNPSYVVARPDGTLLLRITKKASFMERRFEIEQLTEIPADDQLRSILSMFMVALLERNRG